MRRFVMVAASLTACLGTLLLGQPAAAQSPGKTKDKPIKLTAEKLAKECKADPAKAEAKYKGKTLRISGTVGAVYDDILYLPVQLGGGATSDVGIRYGKGNKPAIKTGDKATFEGKFDRVAILGPALVECKLVKDDEKGKK